MNGTDAGPNGRPIVLLHGYSAKADSLVEWQTQLIALGYQAATIHLGNYVTLSNEVTVKDLAEGFDRALRTIGIDQKQEFDAIVHSTGMLVARAWLTAFEGRRARLKHLIGLAPATFGSPIASKGRGWIGAINALLHGNDTFGPDFAAAGDKILAALELGSDFTWNLAHLDLLLDESAAKLVGELPMEARGAALREHGKVFYGPDGETPYPFILDGLDAYTGIAGLADTPGTDGVVRWSGVGFNVRKVVLDLTEDPARPANKPRIDVQPWRNTQTPLALVHGYNHGTILKSPSPGLVDAIDRALRVATAEDYAAWVKDYAWNVADDPAAGVGAGNHPFPIRAFDADMNALEVDGDRPDEFQQLVVRAVDHRGDPIYDYHIQFYSRDADGRTEEVVLGDDVIDIHPYRNDSSFRCHHVNLTELRARGLSNLWLRVIAPSGSTWYDYFGLGQAGAWDASIDLSTAFEGIQAAKVDASAGDVGSFALFYPYTTTLVEVRLMRVPLPFNGTESGLFEWFLAGS
jgi:hypothetical protein